MITTAQQFISYETTGELDAGQILDLVHVPDGHSVEVALIGWQTPANDYNGLFLHFSPINGSGLISFATWGREADAIIEFRDSNLERRLVDEITLRWPGSVIYDFGCLCCGSEPPQLYVAC